MRNNFPPVLTFNVKKQWFDKIKSGEKTHEYREVKDFWTIRLINTFFNCHTKKDKRHSMEYFLRALYRGVIYEPLEFITICFMNGMVDEKTKPRLYAILKSVRIVDGKDTDLKINKPVYDIEFQLIKNNKPLKVKSKRGEIDNAG